MKLQSRHRQAYGTFLIACGFVGSVAAQSVHNLDFLLTNPGFESGLAGWAYSGASVNPNTYLTDAEWNAQSWASSSPFYSDSQLATYYLGRPWGLNPDITHIDQSGVPGDLTTILAAAVGLNFVGSRQDGYSGHYLTGGGPGTPVTYYDTNFQLQQSVAGAFAAGDEFTLTLWSTRGRLNGDWGTENASSDGSASRLRVGLSRQTGLNAFSAPDVLEFTNWGVDGQWAWQTFRWTLSQATSYGVRLQITGINQNHDRFVAVDMGLIPEPGVAALGLLGGVALLRRRRNG